ncbi:MAG: C4-type zinc ribbon domain-containing protein [Bacteroidales bacterium]
MAAKAKKDTVKKRSAQPKAVKVERTKRNENVDERLEQKIEKTLTSLYTLQKIDSHIDKIRNIRGELPLEVQDLEDELVGLETRISKFKNEIADIENSILAKKNAIKDSEALIARYKDQQMNVRNNREYDSLSKEIEFQTLEIQLAEKRILESNEEKARKQEEIDNAEKELDERKKDLEVKRSELKDIVTETEKEEKALMERSRENQDNIEDRLLTAYNRIRKNARNGLAVVQVERDACGGCFNKIPPQHQLDIKLHKKIIVCEYCGRILVDDDIANNVDAN